MTEAIYDGPKGPDDEQLEQILATLPPQEIRPNYDPSLAEGTAFMDGRFEITEVNGREAIVKVQDLIKVFGNPAFLKIIATALSQIRTEGVVTSPEDAKTTYTLEPPMKGKEKTAFYRAVLRKLLEQTINAENGSEIPPSSIEEVIRSRDNRISVAKDGNNTHGGYTAPVVQWPPINGHLIYEHTEPTLASVRIPQELKYAMGRTRENENTPLMREKQIKAGLQLLDRFDDFSIPPTLQKLSPRLDTDSSSTNSTDGSSLQGLARTAHTLLMLMLEKEDKKEEKLTISIRLAPETLKDLRERCGGDSSKVGPLIELALTLYHKSLGAQV